MKPNDSPKRTHHSKWDPAILALLQHGTREQAAQAACINAATLYRWMHDPDFQRALLEARRDVFGQAMGRLQQATSTAVDTLIGIMTDVAAPVGGRVQAARCVLEQSRKSLELDDLKIQVEGLQSWQDAKQEGNCANGESQPVN